MATWLRAYHAVVAQFRPAADAAWREGGRWQPALSIGHNDAAPHDAAWADNRLVAFIDWDFAGTVTREWDVAFTAFGWVLLHARHVIEPEGFTASSARPGACACF